MFKKLWKDESGQGMVEYALIIAVVAIVVIAAGPFIATFIGGIFSEANVSGTMSDSDTLGAAFQSGMNP